MPRKLATRERVTAAEQAIAAVREREWERSIRSAKTRQRLNSRPN